MPVEEPNMAYINCTPAEALARFEADLAKWGDRQWCYNYPGNYKYAGVTSYYWCALQVVRNLLPGRDFRKEISAWAYVPAWYNFMAAAPASHFLTVDHTAARAGDIIIYSRNGGHYHIGMIRAKTQGDTMYTAEGDTSSAQFPGSDSTGGAICHRTRSVAAQSSGGYSFRIWRPGYKKPAKKPNPPAQKIAVDGRFGDASTKALQALAGTPQDGVISSQPSTVKPYNPNLLTCQYVRPSKAEGSQLATWVQKRVGVKADGRWGPGTNKGVQLHVGVKADGEFGPITARAVQSAINEGKF